MPDVILDVPLAQPAVGNDWSFVCPAGIYEILSVRGILTTSAVVANRNVGLNIIAAAGQTLFQMFCSALQAASISGRYSFAPGLASGSVISAAIQAETLGVPLPAIIRTGDQIQSVTLALDPGDQWSAIIVRLRSR